MSEPTKPADELERLAKMADVEAERIEQTIRRCFPATYAEAVQDEAALRAEAADWRTIADIIRRAP